MKRRVPFVAIVAIGSTCAMNVAADAPTGPNGQYALFTKDDRRITDQHTHLVWEREISGSLVDPNVDIYCVAPTRLPTVKELLTLVDETPTLVYDTTLGTTLNVHIDQNAFAYSAGYVRVDAPFCTQTKDAAATVRYVVDFATGEAKTIATGSATARCRVRCVQYVKP